MQFEAEGSESSPGSPRGLPARGVVGFRLPIRDAS